MMNSKTQLIAN